MTKKVIPGTSAGGWGRASWEVFLESDKGGPGPVVGESAAR